MLKKCQEILGYCIAEKCKQKPRKKYTKTKGPIYVKKLFLWNVPLVVVQFTGANLDTRTA
jgi:hypothetical protein